MSQGLKSDRHRWIEVPSEDRVLRTGVETVCSKCGARMWRLTKTNYVKKLYAPPGAKTLGIFKLQPPCRSEVA